MALLCQRCLFDSKIIKQLVFDDKKNRQLLKKSIFTLYFFGLSLLSPHKRLFRNIVAVTRDEHYMKRALQLATLGSGHVAPNPLVGACIVVDDRIIGEGYHAVFGGPHAEVMAVNAVSDKTLLKQATIYVTLEPCAHVGKTPPCANLLIDAGVKRVVIAMKDPFAKVNGRGIQLLLDAGIEVTTGVLEDEAVELNKRFITFHQKKRPFVTLKWAESKDGFIAPAEHQSGTVSWISQPESQLFTHFMRTQEQAILVGKNTVIQDNPSLTARAFHGNNPIRVVLDFDLSLEPHYAIFNTDSKTIVINALHSKSEGNIEYVKAKDRTVASIWNCLYELGINSVIVEGGTTTLQQVIDSNLWDEALVIVGNKVLDNGLQAPHFDSKPTRFFQFHDDEFRFHVNRK